MDFEFYGFVKYHGLNSGVTGNDLGSWLGVAENVGQAMCYYVLQPNGRVIVHSTVRPLLKEEWLDESETALRLEFDTSIKTIYGAFDDTLIHEVANEELEEYPHKDEIDDLDDTEQQHDEVHGPDDLVNVQLMLPHGDRNEISKVIGRKSNIDGNYIGRKHTNPILDSKIFTVEFPDGEQQDISYNTLAEQI